MIQRVIITAIAIFCFACGGDNDTSPKKETFEAASFSEFLEKIQEYDTSGRQEIVDILLDTLTGSPVIENTQDVYFIYKSSASQVELAGDMNGWNPSSSPFTKVEATNLWYRSETYESTARLDYKFVTGGNNWILDPRNPNRVSGGFGPNSELAMPGYVQPWEIEKNEQIPSGIEESHTITSLNTGSSYQIRVYLPPDYSFEQSYPTVYFQDGSEYIQLGSAQTVMDNLIDAALIDPVIAVFVVPNDRNAEYAFGVRHQYSRFYAEELVPFIDDNYATIDSPEFRAIIGDSYGGNISALISFTYPEVFGNCGLHSGAFQPNDYEVNTLIMEGGTKDIQVASIWGTYEGLYSNMRNIKDFLLVEGYEVYWKELPEGHSWGLWRATTDDMLIFFFPPQD